MYYIVEITPQGIETFLEGFEEVGEAWDVLSRLRCEARRARDTVLGSSRPIGYDSCPDRRGDRGFAGCT